MKPITTPLKTDNKEAVINLQAALIFLLDKKQFKLTDDELQTYSKQLNEEMQLARYGDGTKKLVTIFQEQYGIAADKGIVQEATVGKLNELLKGLGAIDFPPNTFIVKGTITYDNGKPCIKAIVKAYDKDIRTEEELGKAETDDTGNYEITYSSEQFSKPDKEKPGLLIKVVDVANPGEQLPKISDIFFNAPVVQEISLSILALKERPVSEWENMDAQLLPLLKDQKKSFPQAVISENLPPEELQPDDIAFISKYSGIDQNQVQLWSLAYKIAKVKDGIPASVFYGWWRMDMTQDMDQLWKKSIGDLLEGLKNAVAKNIIPAIDDDGLKKVQGALETTHVDVILKPAPEGKPASFGDIIAAGKVNGAAWIDKDKLSKLAVIQHQLDPDAVDFTDKVAPINLTPVEQTKLQQTLRLDKLTQNNPALISGLQTFVAKDQDASLNSLASLQPDNWIDLAYEHGTPAGTFIEPEVYAKQMEMAVEERLPTLTLVNKINNGFLFKDQPGITVIAQTLAAKTDFDITKDDVKNIGLDEEKTALVQKMQNLKKLGATWDETEVLINNGLTNVAKLADYNPDQIINIVGDDIDISSVKAIHQKVKTQQAIGIGIMAYTQGVFSGPSSAVMVPRIFSQSKIEAKPTLRILFGALEQCDCDPCMSVLSPAAYYADLLNFIDNSPKPINSDKLQPGSVLIEKRPDLYDLELSCDNSEIVLPHIDLVLEILENAVVFPTEIPLQAGESLWDETDLKKISNSVKTVLKKTSEDKVGELEVLKTGKDGKILIINDNYRRWIIDPSEEGFYTTKGNNDELTKYWNITDNNIIAALLVWLDSSKGADEHNIPADIKTFFEEELMRLQNDPRNPQSIVSYSIKQSKPGKQWQVRYKTQNIIQIAKGAGKSEITITSADGNKTTKKQYSDAAANATEKALKQGEWGGVLVKSNTNKKLEIMHIGQGFQLTNNYVTDLFYSNAKIEIKGLTYQSTINDRDLLARAQNKNPMAYEELAKASSVFPWSLPYDEYLTELRILLSKAGVPRLDLINTHLPDDKKYTDIVWASEVLGISPIQKNIITTAKSGSELWTSWGLKLEGPNYTIHDSFSDKPVTLSRAVDLLKKASVVMQQANVSFSDLQYLLSTQYINPGSLVKLQVDDHCDPSNTILQNADIAPNFFDRFHRFVRLWKITSISISELDSFISATIIDNRRTLDDDAAIIHIAQLKILQQKLGVSFQTVVSFFSGFIDNPTIVFINGKRIDSLSLYNKIFQDIRLEKSLNKDFAYGQFIKNNSFLHDKPLTELLPYIATCVGLRLSDLNLLIEPVDSSEVVADLKNKSASLYYLLCIWRNVSLANILQLSLSEYTAACRLICHVDSIFTSPETLLNFCDEVAFVKKSGIGFEALEGVLTTKNDGTVLPEKELDDIINGLKAELSKVKDYYCLESPLMKTALSTSPNTGIKIPVFSIPKNDTDRWESWGLRKAQIAGKWDGTHWEVELSAGSTIAGEPLKLLRLQDLLAKQSNTSVAQLTILLNTNFLTESHPNLLSAVLNTDGVLEIANLTAQHLDKIKLFLIVQRALNCEIENESLDILLSSFLVAGKEPLDADLNQLLQKNNSVTSQRKQTAISYLSKIFKLPEETVNDLLSNHFNATLNGSKVYAIELFIASEFKKEGAQDETPNTNSVTAILLKLQKTATLNNFWKATSAQLKWLKQSSLSAGFSGIIPDSLQTGTMNYIHWKQSTLLFELAQSSAETEATLSEYLKKQFASEKRIMDDTIIKVFTDAFVVTVDDVKGALHSQNMNTELSIHPVIPATQFDPIFINKLFKYLSALQKSGLTSNDFKLSISEAASIDVVRIATKLLYVRYGKDFAAALQEVNNKLRIEQRDRLVDYLCWRDGLRDANALYEKYLIDVEMQPCMKTTRLLQATAAAQLFVFRCLMNLEENIAPESFDKKRWEWTQNYRVWEANRRVFLYPENWLYPELRDDKTEIFKTFETYLTQNEANHENGVNGLSGCLDNLVEVSQISVVGMCTDIEPTNNIVSGSNEMSNSLYLVGRTKNPPYTFYWCKAVSFNEHGMRWSGWERIDQDLSRDHIIPFIYEGDFHIGWPLIQEIEKDEDAIKKTFYELNICWSRKTSTGWTQRKEGRDTLLVEKLFNRDERSMFSFKWIKPEDTNISIGDKAQIEVLIAQSATVPSLPAPDNPNKAIITLWTPGHVFDSKDPYWSLNIYANSFVKYKTNRIAKAKLNVKIIGIKWEGNTSEIIGWRQGADADTHTPTSDSYPIFAGSIFGPLKLKLVASAFGITKTVECDLIAALPFFGGSGSIAINFLFEDVDESDPNSIDISAPLKMLSKSSFVLESGNNGKWVTSVNPLPVDPKPNSYFWSSGFLERAGNGVPPFSPGFPEQMFVLEELETINKTKKNYYVEEGNKRLLACYVGETLTNLYPFSYSEASFYKSQSAIAPEHLFKIEVQSKGDNSWFGIDSISQWVGTTKIIVDPRDNISLGFDLSVPFALYNWEVFYHLPMYAANFLSKQHRFEEARKWFHFIFDPTTNDSETGANRFWNFLPFRKNNEIERADKLLDILANLNSFEDDRIHVQSQIAAWLADPFNPFAVARMRIGAFEWFTVTSYIRNLIAWGDQLFRRDTRESINEATMLYVMASNILGRRKEKMRGRQNNLSPKSYRSLNLGDKLDDFANKWVTFSQTDLVQDMPQTNRSHLVRNDLDQVASIGSTYFCVPPNDKITQLWDDAEDRLFKIRNCQNIDGIVRNLPLLDPPIDPELLIRAKAAGLSISDVLSDMYAPLPLHRFNVMHQNAMVLCNEVKSLGSALLSAIEKKDAEHLSLLRSGQEIEMLKSVEWVKNEQINEAAANIESINKSRENIKSRILYLQRQMGVKEFTFDADGIPVVEQSYISQPSSNFDWTTGDLSELGLIQSEVDQIIFMQTNNILNIIGGAFHTASGLAHTISAINAGIPGPLEIAAKKAEQSGFALTAYGTLFNTLASHYAMLEKRSGQMAGWQRRRDEWLYQAKTAVLEIKQLDKQIIASEIRKAISEKELENHHKQIDHSSNLDEFVRKQKFSSETLYIWMESQLSNVYNVAYQMALDQAKKAEKAYRFELGDEESPKFIQPGYWDSLRKGLLAGDALSQDLRRMEIAYLEKNKREFEITKHISTAMIQPGAILTLRETGSCDIELPEELFDLDFPGQYFRRIKSVSISIPCIAGPYTSMNATLRLIKNEYRFKATDDPASYAKSSGDLRFREIRNPVTAIATSSSQNDSGVFELNFRDERYLPFEGAGAISTWRLELTSDTKLRQFDYNTISDIILHLKYTAREDSALKEAAISHLKTLMSNAAEGKIFGRLLSLKNDFPDIFHEMKSGKPDPDLKEINLSKMFFPYFSNSFIINFTPADVSFFTKEGVPILAGVETIICTGVAYTHEDHVLTVNFKPSYVAGKEMGDILILINYKLSTPPTTPVN